MELHDIGWAVEQMRGGGLVYREGWNGKGQYLGLHDETDLPAGMTLPFVYIRTVQGDYIPWLCSQADLLAQDWKALI